MCWVAACVLKTVTGQNIVTVCDETYTDCGLFGGGLAVSTGKLAVFDDKQNGFATHGSFRHLEET